MISIRTVPPTFKTILNTKLFHTHSTNPNFFCTKICNIHKICNNHKISNTAIYDQTIFKRNLYNDHKFKSNQQTPTESTIIDEDKNSNKEITNSLGMALLQLNDNKQQYLVIPISQHVQIPNMKNIQELPKNILHDIERINDVLGKINFSTLTYADQNQLDKKDSLNEVEAISIPTKTVSTPPTKTVTTPTKTVTTPTIQKTKGNSDKNFNDNIEDVNIYENPIDILDVNHKGQDFMIKTPFTGVTLKINIDKSEAENFLKKPKPNNSNISLPVNATIEGSVDLHRNKINNMKTFTEINKNKNDLLVSAYICKVNKKKERCAVKPKCDFGGKAGKLELCQLYQKAVERANLLRETYDPPRRRVKIVLNRDQYKKEIPCNPPRKHDS